MTFKRTQVRILLDGDTEERVVDIRHGDRVRAEMEAAKQGIPADRAVYQHAHLTVISWAAAARLGYYEKGYQAYCTDLIDLEVVTNPDGTAATVEVGPTQAEPSRSA